MKMKFNDLIKKSKELGSNISDIGKDKIKKHIRDKAYKDVVKECIEKGADITTMEVEDIEYLVAEKEKEIYDKTKNMGIGALATYLGIESLSF